MHSNDRFLKPEVIKKITRLELRAQRIVEGFLAGIHRSPYFGQSVEFVQHREYVAGDDLRHVDWKIWGRQDRLYVKQYEEDTNLRANLWLDVSGSMAFGSGALSKSEYAASLAACLTYLTLRQQDSIACLGFDNEIRWSIPPSSKRNQLAKMITCLQDSKSVEKTELESVFRSAAATIRHKGVVIVISDLFADVDTTLAGLRLLCQQGHDVALFHILDDAELDFRFSGITQFMDLESGAELTGDPRILRDDYLKSMNQFLSQIRKGVATLDIDYTLCRTSEPLDALLATFLNRTLPKSFASK